MGLASPSTRPAPARDHERRGAHLVTVARRPRRVARLDGSRRAGLRIEVRRQGAVYFFGVSAAAGAVKRGCAVSVARIQQGDVRGAPPDSMSDANSRGNSVARIAAAAAL